MTHAVESQYGDDNSTQQGAGKYGFYSVVTGAGDGRLEYEDLWSYDDLDGGGHLLPEAVGQTCQVTLLELLAHLEYRDS